MRFGDWIRFNESGSCVITGRSDATLNRGGVRIATAEIYRTVEANAPIADSLVVHLEDPDAGPGELILWLENEEHPCVISQWRVARGARAHKAAQVGVPATWPTTCAACSARQGHCGRALDRQVEVLLDQIPADRGMLTQA